MAYRAALVRVLSVGMSAAAGIVGVRAALSLGAGQSTTVVAVLSWVIFIALGQLGYGRPAYAAIRQRYVQQDLRREALDELTRMTVRQAVVSLLVYVLLMSGVAAYQRYGGDIWPFLCLAAGVGSMGAATFLRDLAYATSREATYELCELARRTVLLLCLLLLGRGASMPLLGMVCLAVAAVTSLVQLRHLRGAVNARTALAGTAQPPTMRALRTDARRYLLFSLSELCLYNAPLLVFTASNNGGGIIDFSIWTKLFMLVVLPMRIVADARLNEVTAAFFSAHAGHARSKLLQSCAAAIAAVLVCGLAVSLLQPQLLTLMAPGRTWSDPWLLASLWAWGLLNAAQHVFGSFTVSHGGGHRFAALASAATCTGVLLAMVGADRLGWALGPAMALAAVPYAVSAGAFVVHGLRQLHQASPSGH